MSSALIPLLSADLPFFESVDCSLQLFSRDFWNFFHFFRVGAFVVFQLNIIVFSDFLVRLLSEVMLCCSELFFDCFYGRHLFLVY